MGKKTKKFVDPSDSPTPAPVTETEEEQHPQILKCTRCQFNTRYPEEQAYWGAKDNKGKYINKSDTPLCPCCYVELVPYP